MGQKNHQSLRVVISLYTFRNWNLIFWLLVFLSINVHAATSEVVIFNSTYSAAPGDIVGLQGEGFGDAPSVTLEATGNAPEVNLQLVNSYGQGWLTFRIPKNVTDIT